MTKKKQEDKKKPLANPDVMGLHAEVLEQPITQTLEQNYMPYAMSVIVSRAIPEIDGFKPSHRKLLYTMYKMGLLTGARTKSANIVGQTMRLNPHGDAAIYETMVRLSKGYDALLTPFVDSKGNFGKVYSRDTSYAASRYTEAKLAPICGEIFKDIDKDTVDFADNYDSSTKEPTLLPTSFPNVLVSANTGIAVGMASQICSFNLAEVCETTINYISDPTIDIMQTLPAPDFTTGGELIYNVSEMQLIYETGRGGFKVRSRYRYIQSENLIEVYEIPYSTTAEAIIDKIIELSKAGKLKEISDIRDETDLSGLKIAIDLKRGTDPDKLMQKLFKMTPLMDTFSCNFNILISGNPKVMGVKEILDEWISWREQSIKRRVYFELQKKKEKLHLLNGLKKILLDIDKAIKIIRSTERDAEVVPNLMIGFGIDQIQSEYVAEIKLRNINKEYILRRVEETGELEAEILDLENVLSSRKRVKNIIVSELKGVIKKYSAPRKTGLVAADEIEDFVEVEMVDDYAVTLFVTRDGYFKKITAASLRMNAEQKLKETDEVTQTIESNNRSEILVFTDKQQVYKARISDFDDCKASVLGVFLPTALNFAEGENVFTVIDPEDYSAHLLLFFENGKIGRIELSSYATKTNRKRLTGAFSDKSPLRTILLLKEEREIAVFSSEGRALVFSSAQLTSKTSRTTQGVSVMNLKKKFILDYADYVEKTRIVNSSRYKVRSIPAAGALLQDQDRGEQQLSFIED